MYICICSHPGGKHLINCRDQNLTRSIEIEKAKEKLQEVMDAEFKREHNMTTGFPALDDALGIYPLLTGDFPKGELFVLASRFKTGMDEILDGVRSRRNAMSDNDLYAVKAGATYKHFKGHEYEVVSLGIHTETNERFVCYRSKGNNELVWIRPITMFFEKIEVEGAIVPRFQLIEDSAVKPKS